MPVQRTRVVSITRFLEGWPNESFVQKKFGCGHPDCGKAFGRLYDLDRHKPTHGEREDREFVCWHEACGFRANQKGGLENHLNSIHKKVRLPCDAPGCPKTYSDPSSLSRHRRKFHHRVEREDTPTNRSSAKRSAILQGASPHGDFHTAIDVPPDCWSIDQQIQTRHQAYDATPGAAPPWGYYPDVPSGSSLLCREEPSIPHPPQSTVHEGIDTTRDQSCRCLECDFGESLTLAPLRGRYQDVQGQRQSEAPLPFSHPRSSHVPPSDHRSNVAPTPNDPRTSSAYLRPNPRMLFDL